MSRNIHRPGANLLESKLQVQPKSFGARLRLNRQTVAPRAFNTPFDEVGSNPLAMTAEVDAEIVEVVAVFFVKPGKEARPESE